MRTQLPILVDPKRGIYKQGHADGFYSTYSYFWAISMPMWVEGLILTFLFATIDFWLVLYSSLFWVYIYFVFIVILLWWTAEGLMFALAGVCKMRGRVRVALALSLRPSIPPYVPPSQEAMEMVAWN